MSVFFIVGGSSGTGLELAQQLASGGHEVHATYHQHPQPSSPSIHYHPFNVLEDTPTFAYLPERLDGLVYCPGSIHLRPFPRIRPDEFEQDFRLNVMGAIRVIQALLPRLKAAEGSASIVLFSTVAVQLGLPFHTQVSVSKGAVEGLARSLAAELAPRIRVNCIAPSITDTPLAAALLATPEKQEAAAQRHPLKKIGSASDLARMASFLLTEESGWITGQIFKVDGGLSAIRG